MRQKHYDTEKQIIDKIDAKRLKVESLNAEACTLEASSKKFFKEAADMDQSDNEQDIEAWRELRGQAEYAKEQAMRYRKWAKRLEEVVLPKLGDTLSEFRTAPMIAVLGQNHSVSSSV